MDIYYAFMRSSIPYFFRIIFVGFILYIVTNIFFPLIAWSYSFDADTEDFTYSDDTFYNTNQPNYASGNYSATGGSSGGALHVALGGIDKRDIKNGMSGGWVDCLFWIFILPLFSSR